MSKRFFILIILSCVVGLSAEEHEGGHHTIKKSRKTNQRSPGEDPCLGGQGLAAFANGEDYNMPGMVALLTDPSCQGRYNQISREALSQRISFFDEPFRFRQLASHYNPASLQSVEQTSQTLLRVLPVVLKNHPLTNDAILPVLGQTAILSQPAARKVLAEMVQNELIASDPLIKSSTQDKSKLASDLAKTLLSLGADSAFVAQEVAKATEELALSAQVDSLGKILSALGEAARAEDLIVPTLEQTVDSAQRGVEKGTPFTSLDNRQKLLKLFFENVKPTFFSEPEFEKFSLSYNQALKTLLENKELGRTVLRDLWKECLKVLSNNPHQKALSLALSLSLTGELVYLNEEDKNLLLLAANQYPSLAIAVQRGFLAGWEEAWDQVNDEKIPPALFNKRKDQYFIPFVVKILELNPNLIDTDWAKFVWEKGFIKESQIETRFPKIVLSHLNKREEISQNLLGADSFSSSATVLAQNMATHFALSSVQLPALRSWVKTQEGSAK